MNTFFAESGKKRPMHDVDIYGALISPGSRWRHYKGQHYEAIAVAESAIDGELVVVYHPVGSPHRVYTRPVDDWCMKIVDTNGVSRMRFEAVPKLGQGC